MRLDQRIRAIRLLEMIEEEPATARELGISVKQRIVEQKGDLEREERWPEEFGAIAR